jgi:oligopeptide transport system permease protein
MTVADPATNTVDTLLWVVVPYVCLAVFAVGHWWRYRYDKFGWTTRSSQLYERRLLRWGSPLFHFGILFVLLGHIGGLGIPKSWTDAVGISETAYHALAIVTGAIAGFYGGWLDSILSRLSDIFFSIPLLLAAIVVISVINNVWPDRGFWLSVIVIVLALALFAWPQITRQMRGAVLEVKNLEFVDAATAIGASRFKNLTRHIVPNALAPVIVTATISLGVFIVAEAALSFLGLGLPSNVVSWGNDLSDAQNQVRSGQHLVVMWVPATALAITVLGFILLGEAVREALDPKGRKA